MRTLVIGYGNVLRSDDGVGVFLAGRLAEERLPDVEVKTFHQLPFEIAEDLAPFRRVLLVDCSSAGPAVQIRKIIPGAGSGAAGSHHLGPETLAALAEKIYRTSPDIYLCTVRGENFDFGDRMTEGTLRRAQRAAERIRSLLAGRPFGEENHA
jgi:hydrogenase maturation protease